MPLNLSNTIPFFLSLPKFTLICLRLGRFSGIILSNTSKGNCKSKFFKFSWYKGKLCSRFILARDIPVKE